MAESIRLAEVAIDIVRKDIKHVHLSVHPPTGRVRIAAPRRLGVDALRAFAIGKLGWIREQQRRICEQERETPREYLDRETHYVWGRRCLLKLIEHDVPPTVAWRHHRLVLTVRPGTDASRRAEILDGWYREQLRQEAEALIARWQRRLGVRAERFFVQRMRTRWGSCNPKAGTLRLNTELARKPRECLEYIVVHELLHLVEPTHNERFQTLLTRHLPAWPQRRALLNRLPLRHEDWSY